MRKIALAVPVLPLVLLASACASGGAPADQAGSADPSPSAPASGASGWQPREAAHGAAQPRLLISDAGSGTVRVLDVASGQNAGKVEAVGPTRFSVAGADGSQVFLVQGDDDTVQLLDTGIRYEAHGEHEDAQHVDPSLVDGAIEVAQPSHAVVHGDHAAIFADGDAGISLVHIGEEVPEKLTAQAQLDAGPAHHGVAVPLGHSIVASLGDSGEERIGAQVIGEDGEVVEKFKKCPGLHGEFAPDDETVLFGCHDGVLKVQHEDGQWHADKIANPTESEEDYVSALAGPPGGASVLGSYGENAVVLIDAEHEGMTRVELPAAYGDLAWDPYWKQGMVLTADGRLHAVDPESGEITHSARVTEPFQTESTTGGRAVVVAGESHVYLINPTTKELVEVAVSRDGFSVERSMKLGFVPRDLAAVGLPDLPSDGDSNGDGHGHEEHEHEEGHEH